MKVLIVGIIVLALAVAGVSTYLIRTFGGEEDIAELQKQKPKLRVLVATKNLRPGNVLRVDGMNWLPWPEESMNPLFTAATNDDEAAKRIKDFEGGVVREIINTGEPILASKIFKTDKPSFLAGLLEAGMRAVSFAVSPQTGAAGFILPGNRVDILLTHDKLKQVMQKRERGKKKDPAAPLLVLNQTTETIMENVKVLAVNQVADLAEGDSLVASTVTLELTPKQAQLLITARTMGRLTMVLRSLQTPEAADGKTTSKKKMPSYTTDVEVSGVLTNLNAILEEKKAKSDKKTGKKTAKPTPEKSSVIKVYKGGAGTFEEVKIKR